MLDQLVIFPRDVPTFAASDCAAVCWLRCPPTTPPHPHVEAVAILFTIYRVNMSRSSRLPAQATASVAPPIASGWVDPGAHRQVVELVRLLLDWCVVMWFLPQSLGCQRIPTPVRCNFSIWFGTHDAWCSVHELHNLGEMILHYLMYCRFILYTRCIMLSSYIPLSESRKLQNWLMISTYFGSVATVLGFSTWFGSQEL